MPSPFPGMDPYIEDQKWSGFHNILIVQLAESLVAALRPRYEIDLEERIYVETAEGESGFFRPDVTVSTGLTTGRSSTSGAVLDVEPNIYTLSIPQTIEETEAYLVIRKTGEREVVTVIEVLSPSNKRPSAEGRLEYLKKRHTVLRSDAHLVEIDLLLQGERLPTVRPLMPTTDYCAFVCRAGQRPQAEVFEWTLKQRMPRIPIPLLPADPDAIVDLQEALTTVYDRLGYDYSIHYENPLGVRIRKEDESWVREIAASRLKA